MGSRKGAATARRKPGSKIAQIYGGLEISERHRHRFEVNNKFRKLLEDAGLIIAGLHAPKNLVEIVELKDHPWFVATQFHPEFTSTPRDGHPLFTGFVRAARAYRGSQLPAAAGA